MRGGRRRQERAATAAVAAAVQLAVLQIRTMAYRREGMPQFFGDVEYQEQIRRLADLCDTLVPGLRSRHGYPATEALTYTWDVADDDQRAWLRDAVAWGGGALDDLVDTRAGDR